jgi:hypothetical protein
MDWDDALQAHETGLEPLTFDTVEDIEYLGKRAYKMGSYVPTGWKLTHRIFVDKGFGSHARSIGDVKSILTQLHSLCGNAFGVALSHEGQFHIHLDVYFVTARRKGTAQAKRLLSAEREVHEANDILTESDFTEDKVFRWVCIDCGEECAANSEYDYITCAYCGSTFDKDTVK